MSSRDTDFDNLKRNFAQIQYKHLMEEEWNKKYVGLPYQAKINLADRILTQKNFPSGPSAEVIRRFKDSIRSQKELVQKQKKAYEERKKREAVMENSMREPANEEDARKEKPERSEHTEARPGAEKKELNGKPENEDVSLFLIGRFVFPLLIQPFVLSS